MDSWNRQNEETWEQNGETQGNAEYTQTSAEYTQINGEYKEPGKKTGMKGKLGIFGVIGVILLKMKGILLGGLSLLKGGFILVKSMKFLGTFVSMFLTILIYTQTYGFPYALGFVLLIFAHELGHTLMAKNEGLDVSTPMFIPFVGAFIRMKELPKSAVMEAKIAMGGPVLGSIAAVGCLGIYWMSGSSLFLHLAYSGFLINLFNLIPLSPLDGGRITGAISTKIWILGLVIAGIVMIWMFSPILLMILILGGVEAYQRWKNPNPVYYELSPEARGIIALVYFGLVAFLGGGMAIIFHGGL